MGSWRKEVGGANAPEAGAGTALPVGSQRSCDQQGWGCQAGTCLLGKEREQQRLLSDAGMWFV